MELLIVVVVLAILVRGMLVDLFDGPQVSAFLTVFVSIAIAGLPFVVLAVLVGATVVAFVPANVVSGPPGLAGLDRLLAPSTEDTRRGALLAGVTFLLLSPAGNPVVIAATAVAFPGEPLMVLARFVAGLIVTAAMGGLWPWFARRYATLPGEVVGAAPVSPRGSTAAAAGSPARAEPISSADSNSGVAAARGWPVFWERCRVDVIRAGGVLVFGAFAVAVLTVWLPAPWLAAIAHSGLFAVVALALLAVLLAVRPGPDAFVAAALSQFPVTAQLAYLVVGPAANLRLFTRQVAHPGPRFAVRYAPTIVLVGVVSALVIGWVVF